MKAIKVLLVGVFALIPFHSVLAASEKTLDSYIPMDENIEYHWAFEQIDDLVSADIINGVMDSYNNMYVKPNDYISRAEFVTMIVTALDLKMQETGKVFPDVKQGAWYYDSVQIAGSLDIITGKPDGRFAPNDKITRAEMTKIIVDAFKKTVVFPDSSYKAFKDVNEKYWAYAYINKAAATEIVYGNNGKFSPLNNATRAEAMAMVQRALHKELTAVAEDSDILEFLSDAIKRENILVEANDYSGLVQLYAETSTGFYRAQGTELQGLESTFEEGETYNIAIDAENMSLLILEKSNRFATVEVMGITALVNYTDSVTNLTYTENIEGIYKLKKDSTNNWRIYNYIPYFFEGE